MSTRFEILKNGERVCICGIHGRGVLSAGITYVAHSDQSNYKLHIGGLGLFDGSRDREVHADWPAPHVSTGDEITIRIMPPGDFDEPEDLSASPKNAVQDPDFGLINYYMNAWDAEISLPSPPIARAHIHLRADDSGPTEMQRNLFQELALQHTRLWPQISTALVRCHPEIESPKELSERINSRVGIEFSEEPHTIEISYRINGEPENRSYFIKLRNWEIVEVSMAQ